MHNCPSLNKSRNQCYALLNPEDAFARGITDGTTIELSTDIGSITLPVKVSAKIMRGVVSVPHGWGHHRKGIKQSLASSTPGVSLNDILDDQAIDKFCGNAALVGQAVTVNRVDRS
jgi:anaerobic selenocysteine-containing dehydrogenase